MITAQFGSKKFEVSSSKLYTPDGVTISEELNIEEKEVNKKKPKVNIKGLKLQTVEFDVRLDARFVDVVTELRFWKDTLLSKNSQIFTLGLYTIGMFYLSKYSVKSITINKSGVYTSAIISLSFTEDGAYANSTQTNFASTAKAQTVTKSAKSSAIKVRKGSTIRPKSGVRWYYTADGAMKKTGTSGKAYQMNMKVKLIYPTRGKITCINPEGLGWLKVEDVTVIKY